MRVAHRRLLLLAALLLPSAAHTQQTALRNWFDDPFFVLTDALPHCPEPAGPRVDAAERQLQSHRRAEKGTTCWLAHECERPNAYAYDRDIAAAIRALPRNEPPWAGSSLWVTVQGRVVYVEGCVSDEARAAAIEAALRRVPHVQQAIAIVTADPAARPPYRPLAPR